MRKVHKSTPPIKQQANQTPDQKPNPTSTPPETPPPASSPPDDFLFLARNKIVEACALASAVADAVAAIPAGVADENTQALANVCERACQEALSAIEKAQRPAPIKTP